MTVHLDPDALCENCCRRAEPDSTFCSVCRDTEISIDPHATTEGPEVIEPPPPGWLARHRARERAVEVRRLAELVWPQLVANSSACESGHLRAAGQAFAAAEAFLAEALRREAQRD